MHNFGLLDKFKTSSGVQGNHCCFADEDNLGHWRAELFHMLSICIQEPFSDTLQKWKKCQPFKDTENFILT